METVNMHEAKTHLSRLVKKAAAGEPFIIAIAGKPMVKVTQVEEAPPPPRVFGGLKGLIKVPDNFDTVLSMELVESKVTPTELHPDTPKPRRRLGFLKGQIKVPDDFDTMYQAEIEEMFYGEG